MKMLTFSNARVYLAIAEEALCESVRLRDEGRRPRPNGEPGWILTPDPEQRSFKQALIAIVFSGAYLEAILRIVGRDRLGPEEYGRIEYGTTYEKKLERLGIADPALLGKCERLRESRNEVVHEKALEVEVDGSGAGRHVAGDPVPRIAQDEAEAAAEIAKEIVAQLLALPRRSARESGRSVEG